MQKTFSPSTPAMRDPRWPDIERKLEKRFGRGTDNEKWALYAIGARLMNDPVRVGNGLAMLKGTARRDAIIIGADFGIHLESAA